MDPGACLSCRRCKCKRKLHEKSETARRTRYLVKPCRQCSHRNSCDACARSDGRMSCKHGSCQRRCSRYRSDSSDTSHCKEERLSGKNNSRSQSSYSRSSNLESGYGSDGSFWMNSNFMFRCPHSIAGKKEEQIHKKSLASSSRRYIHTSSTRIHKHRYSHYCPRIKRSCHGLHCCHNKKRHHENYSSDSDDYRKRHEFSSCRHRNRSHGLGPVGSHEICHLKQPEDITHCSPNSMGVKEELISKTKGFMTGVCIASEDHNVEGSNVGCIEHIQMPFGWEKGSLIINREQNGAMAHCPIGKEKTEKQEHLDEWLQLSLKTSPRTNLIVEGISKSDFKLSLPEVQEHLNVRDCFHSGPSEIKELNINSIQSSAIDFPASSPRLDPFLYYQPRENLDYITVLPDLNLPPDIANGCHGISIPAKWANSRLELHDNCHNSHVKELRCTLLNQRWNWAYSDYEEKCCVSEHAVLPNWLVENSTSHTRIPVIGNEELMGVHIGDSHIKASSISGAADYSHFNDRSFHFSAKTEALVDLIIILDDSEDEWSKQNASRSLPGQHNGFGTCKKSLLPEEISDNHATQVLVHGRNVQGPLSAGNGTEDRVERNIGLRWPFPAHSTENLDDTPPNNSSLQGTGGEYTPQADLAVPKFDNNTMAGYANYRVDNYFDEGGSIGGFRSKENDFSCKSWSDKDIINIPAVGSSKDTLGTLEHVLIEPECIEAPLHIAKAEVQMWDRGITCDLCGQGSSLMYGQWYAWCCGSCLSLCKCTEEHKRKLLLSMKCKKAKYLKKWNGHKWSGKVHRMCGLWSSEVFEKGDARDRLEGLMDAVRRGRSLLCAECKRFGATLGCRVEKCKRSFHYTCADRLSSQLRCRMWEGFKLPVACYHHSHVDHYCMTAKDKTPYVNIKCTTNPVIANGNQHATISSKKPKFEDTISNETVMPTGDLNINNQEEKTPPGVQDDHAMTPCLFNSFKKRRGIDPTIRKDIAGDLKIDERRSEKARQTSCRLV